MSDDDFPDYTAQNEPNEEALMKAFDRMMDEAPVRFLPAPGVQGEATLGELEQILANLPPGAQMTIQKPINYETPLERDIRMGQEQFYARRRRQTPGMPWSQSETPATDIQRRLMALSDEQRQAVLEQIQAAKVGTLAPDPEQERAKIREQLRPTAPPDSAAVDKMIEDALSEETDLAREDAKVCFNALCDMRYALDILRGIDDPIIRGAVVNLEMAAIGVAKRGQRG